VWTETEFVNLVQPLVLDPGVDDVLGEYAALQQVAVVDLEGVQDLLQRSGDLPDQRRLLGRQVVQVLVDRVGWLDLVLHSVKAGLEHRREGEVWVARWVRRAELHPLGRRRLEVHRDPRARRAVPL